MIYKFNKYFSISASVIDLGFIQWHNNISNVEISGSYNYQGVPIPSLTNTSNIGTAFMDTLKKVYSFSHDNESYMTALYGKIYVGAYFQPAKWIGFGALSRTKIRDGLIDQQYTLSLNLKPSNGFNLTLDYTIVDNTYDNLGFGFYFKTGPLQWYFMSERIPLYWVNARFSSSSGIYFPVPYDEKSFNFHMGLNLVFGSDRSTRIMRLKRDKPLVELDDNIW